MAPCIQPVISGLDLTHFIQLPWSLNSQYPQWVPPLKSQEWELLQPSLHPFWQNATRRLFLAKIGDTFVGRIAAIIDYKYNAYAKTKCGAFGFFECIHDDCVAQSLFSTAAKWLKEQGMEYMRGPVNPSTNYTCGVLVDGFDCYPSLMMPWNPPYYAQMLENWHAYKEQDLFAYRITNNCEVQKNSIEQNTDQENLFTVRKASKKTLASDIKIMLDLYRKSWAKNWYFSPLSQSEEDYLVSELLPIVDTNYFILFFQNTEPAAGMVALPNLNPLLRAMNGTISPLTLWHYIKNRKKFTENYRIMLFGILEKYRLLGLPRLLFEYMLKQAHNNPNLQWVEGSWVLEDNTAICDLIEDFSGTIAMRYRIYRKELL